MEWEKGCPCRLSRDGAMLPQSKGEIALHPTFCSKKIFESEPNRCLFRAGGHVPASAPQQWTSATTFIFEGWSGRRAVCAGSLGTVQCWPRARERWPFLRLSFEKNFESEPNHWLFQAGGHVPASDPEQWTSAVTFIFEGGSGRRAVCAGSPGTVQCWPRARKQWPFFQLSLKKNFESEPNRCLFPADEQRTSAMTFIFKGPRGRRAVREHVPTSSRELQSSAVTLIFKGVMGEGLSGLPAQEDPPSLQGQVSISPFSDEKSCPLTCLLVLHSLRVQQWWRLLLTWTGLPCLWTTHQWKQNVSIMPSCEAAVEQVNKSSKLRGGQRQGALCPACQGMSTVTPEEGSEGPFSLKPLKIDLGWQGQPVVEAAKAG